MLVDAVTVCERLSTPHGELELRQRMMESDVQWEITQDGFFICSTNCSISAAELVRYGMEALTDEAREVKVMIGGLGLGFSLREALKYPQVIQADVIEWEKAIIGWNIRFFGPSSKEAMMDVRTRLIAGDFLHVLPEIQNRYHLIALDIDKGPDWLVHPENAAAYGPEFLSLIRERLEPNGVLTVWSDQYHEGFMEMLETIFGNAEVKQVLDKSTDGKPSEAFIYRAIS